jgi:hypothetical protein
MSLQSRCIFFSLTILQNKLVHYLNVGLEPTIVEHISELPLFVDFKVYPQMLQLAESTWNGQTH